MAIPWFVWAGGAFLGAKLMPESFSKANVGEKAKRIAVTIRDLKTRNTPAVVAVNPTAMNELFADVARVEKAFVDTLRPYIGAPDISQWEAIKKSLATYMAADAINASLNVIRSQVFLLVARFEQLCPEGACGKPLGAQHKKMLAEAGGWKWYDYALAGGFGLGAAYLALRTYEAVTAGRGRYKNPPGYATRR